MYYRKAQILFAHICA